MTVITDITRLKDAEARLAQQESTLHVALDNMPGALAYTNDDLDIVIRNDRFADMYPAPAELLQPGRPYAEFLRYLADNGYYGEGDVDALVGKRVESLRNPSGASFEDRTPDGRVYRVGRRRVASGGTVTVITDITELKDTQARLVAAVEEAERANTLAGEKNRMLESLSSKLAKYLSPQLYRSIFSGEKSVEVASQRKKLTIFFSDIAGFTETTDLLESEELTSLLNQYLREMSAIALEHGATIDKFIGDAIMLFFGDPETRGPREDATACVRMAIAMQQRMRDLQAEWRERGQEHVFQLRIGINTGFCTVGNFGSDERVDYTIIGNEVNLASRLQTHADLGGILIAHETCSLVSDAVLTEETGTITVKGFARPVRTRALFSKSTRSEPRIRRCTVSAISGVASSCRPEVISVGVRRKMRQSRFAGGGPLPRIPRCTVSAISVPRRAAGVSSIRISGSRATMSQSFRLPTTWNSLGPFIVWYTFGLRSSLAKVRATGSGIGSMRMTCRR